MSADEITEMGRKAKKRVAEEYTWDKICGQYEDAPCILYDLDGYYTGLRMLLSHMIETGLSSEERQKGICFAKDLAEIKTILNR